MAVRICPPERKIEDMIYIGIDPGVNTGFAVWDTKKRALRIVATFSILEAMSYVATCREVIDPDCHIVFEDARKRKWLSRERNLSEYRGKLMGAGSIKRDCEIWEEYCTERGIPFTAVPPRKGVTKWDAEQFNKMTGWTGRTSNHARDAALLVFGKI